MPSNCGCPKLRPLQRTEENCGGSFPLPPVIDESDGYSIALAKPCNTAFDGVFFAYRRNNRSQTVLLEVHVVPRRRFLLSCAAFVVFACGVNFAQINTAAIYGTVTDQAGGIIPNAHIQVKNELTNVAASTTSNSRGDFTFNFLPIGNYDVSVEATGFQRQIRNDVELSAGQTLQ